MTFNDGNHRSASYLLVLILNVASRTRYALPSNSKELIMDRSQDVDHDELNTCALATAFIGPKGGGCLEHFVYRRLVSNCRYAPVMGHRRPD